MFYLFLPVTVYIVLSLYTMLLSDSRNIVESSLLYKIGTFIEPVTRFFGMGWQTFMSFISAAFAKETVLGTLNAVFAGHSNVADVAFIQPIYFSGSSFSFTLKEMLLSVPREAKWIT